MGKKASIAFLFLFLTFVPRLWAQRLGGGLLFGPTFSAMQLSDIDTASFRLGFGGGVRLAIIPEHSVFGAELDIVYSQQGMKTRSGMDENGHKVTYGMKSSYINVPLLLNIYLRKWNEDDESEQRMVRFRIGPQVGFCLGGSDVETVKLATQTKQTITLWENGCFNRLDYGVTAAVSYWFVEVRYTCGLNNVFKGEGRSLNHVISVTWSDVW